MAPSPNPRLQRTRSAPLRSPLSFKTFGVRTPDPNDADHGKVHLLWRQGRSGCLAQVFKWHSAPLKQESLKWQEPQSFIRV